MGGVLAVGASTAAEAAFDHQFYESGGFLKEGDVGSLPSGSDVTDLDEANDAVGAPQIGPDGLERSFTEVGQRIRVVGALNVAKDSFAVDSSGVPSLKLIINDLIFYESGSNPNNSDNLPTTNPDDGDTLGLFLGDEPDPSRRFKAGDDLTMAYASLSGVSSFTLDNRDSSNQLIAYDIEVVATPLPGALVLFGTGLAGIAGYRRWIKPAA
jgi:hypothetical protein